MRTEFKVALRPARWQTRTSEEDAQELAREIERYEAPMIELYAQRVQANVQRRVNRAKLAAAARFVETVRKAG